MTLAMSLTLHRCRETTEMLCILYADVGDDCIKTVEAYEYMGYLAQTVRGKTCQEWTSDSPHSHSYDKDSMFPDGTAEKAKNYCRNPQKSHVGLWCYTTDPGTSWDVCDRPICGELRPVYSDAELS